MGSTEPPRATAATISGRVDLRVRQLKDEEMITKEHQPGVTNAAFRTPAPRRKPRDKARPGGEKTMDVVAFGNGGPA
ncbi:hypothetical protein [Pseudonocardia sp. NPDC049154]|uniref:hypothetical protein n=1 Tax=Pseudonocardia sp. NPDC049154 TaxID=3155501 RepID=UPI0033C4666D